MKKFHINKSAAKERPTVLITGGASGIGKAAAIYMLDRGWKVVAADIDLEGLEQLPNGIIPIYLDVANEETFSPCLEIMKDITDGLDAIVNCAGTLVVGSVIEIPEDEILSILKINVLGTYRVNRFFFPMVEKRSGRIIVMSSEIGVQTPFPFNGPYAISKYAIEAYSDALRRELLFLGVRVIKFRSGAVDSKMVGIVDRLFQRAASSSKHFENLIKKNIDYARSESANAMDPEYVAEKIYHALTSKRPKICYTIKPDLRRTLLSRLPDFISDRIITWFLNR